MWAEDEVANLLDADSLTLAATGVGADSNETAAAVKKRRARRALLAGGVQQLELDVSTPQMLVVDSDERRQIEAEEAIERLCVPRSTLPLGALILAAALFALAFAVYKRLTRPAKKQLVFFY